MKFHRLAALVLLTLGACRSQQPAEPVSSAPDAQGNTAPSRSTTEANAAVAKALPLAEQQDFEDAKRGLVLSEAKVQIDNASGKRIWDSATYDFVHGDAPASVNPSLWRQAQLNGFHGLFKVTDGVHQVRGYDVSNMTIIEGQSGWIIVDPLTAQETAKAALALARSKLGDKPIVAIIFTHSHVDHFGGIDGVLPEGVDRSKVRIIAPEGFLEEATSENVFAGIAMGRRATYMYGMPLARGPRGHVDTGLGKGPARGTVALAEPTDIVDHTGQEMEIDGVRFIFQYVPDSEAPAELTFYLPDKKAFCGAEIVSHTMHNLYTLRGAKVRDAFKWSDYIDDALHRFGDAEVVFASHHWPVWDNARVIDYLKKQRDMYRYLHDQTLRLANQGATPREIAEQLEMPATLRPVFADRDYYGTVRHNAKAVYQFYFGWYDGNPANLDPLPPVEESKKYVEAMGGAAETQRKAQAAFDAGDYRWAATMLNHLVFADPSNAAAKELLAATYDQLGYRAESGPWRDVYLTGALELRHGIPETQLDPASAKGLLEHLPPALFLDSMASRLNGPKAEGSNLILNFVFTDVGETHVVELENAVLHHRQGEADPRASATVKLTRDFLIRLAIGQAGLKEMIFSNDLQVDGSRMDLLRFFSLLDRTDNRFAIVTPDRE